MRRVQSVAGGEDSVGIRRHVVDLDGVIARAGDHGVAVDDGGETSAAVGIPAIGKRRSGDDAQDVGLGSGRKTRNGSEFAQIPNADGGAGSRVKQRSRRGSGNGDRVDERLAVRNDVSPIGGRQGRMTLVD